MKNQDVVVEMYAQGMSLREIGKALGQSHQYAKRRLASAGVVMRPWHGTGPEHSQWKGGDRPANAGYVRVWIAPDDPLASMRNHQGYVLKHRLVMARKLGRPLTRTETVHHKKPGDRANCAEDNLQLRHGQHGVGVVPCCMDCGSRNIGTTEIAD